MTGAETGTGSGTGTGTGTGIGDHAPVVTPAEQLAVVHGSMTITPNGIGFLWGASDPDGDPLTVSTVQSSGETREITPGGGTLAQGAYGTLNLRSDGTYDYQVNPDMLTGVSGHARDTFNYTVSDGRGGTTASSFSFVIDRAPTPADDQATATSGTLSVDAAHGVLANDTDPDGDTSLAVTRVNGSEALSTPTDGSMGSVTVQGTYGALTLYQNGAYDYAVTNPPPAGVGPGQDTFTYTVRDQWDTGYNTANAALTIVVPEGTGTGTGNPATTSGVAVDGYIDPPPTSRTGV